MKASNNLHASLIVWVLLLFTGSLSSQSFTAKEVVGFPSMDVEDVEKLLIERKWQKHQLEIVTDSNYIRRSWEQLQQNTSIKSYVIYYDFQKDTGENYIIYQFADRDHFKSLKAELKELGYKQINPEKNRKKRKGQDPNMYKEKAEYFYLEKTRSLTIIKEVFYYGLNSFLVYSYKPRSAFARYIVESKDE